MSIDMNILEQIYEKYKDNIFAIGFNYFKNSIEADDFVQETFFKLARSGKDFESEEHLRNWLIRVTAIILTLILAMAGMSYAATDGAVLDSIKVWINGQPAGDGVITENGDGSFTVNIQEGDKIEIQGDGWSSEAQVGDMEGSVTVSDSESEDGLSVESTITIDKVSEGLQ